MPRREYAPPFKTTIKQAVVAALQHVFDGFYTNPDMRGIKVYSGWNLDQVTYPAILVRFNEHRVENVGLSSVEYLFDKNSVKRAFQHSWYQGELEFTVFTRNDYQLDLMTDALMEVLRYGELEDQTRFFLGDILGAEIPEHMQITLMTSMIRPIPPSREETPWPTGSGNEYVWRGGYTVYVAGDFYSADRTGQFIPIDRVNLYPYLYGQTFPDPNPLTVQWSGGTLYGDAPVFFGYADISSIES